jgi:hypothetical protein
MNTQLNFLPKTLNIRRLMLHEAENCFFLTGMDKCYRKYYELVIKKVDDVKTDYSLKDILIENTSEYTEKTI